MKAVGITFWTISLGFQEHLIRQPTPQKPTYTVPYTLFVLLKQTYYLAQRVIDSMDRHDEREHQNDHVRSKSPGADEDTFSAKGSPSSDSNSSCHSRWPTDTNDQQREPPTEQPLDFSFKSKTAFRRFSPPLSEADKSPPQTHDSLDVITCDLPRPWTAPEVRHSNPIVVIPSTSTAATTAAAISPSSAEIPFVTNGYTNGFGLMPFVSSMPSPTLSGLCDTTVAPPLVRPPPSQQAAFPSMSLMSPVTTRSSPPSSSTPTSSKYQRPFKRYQRGEPLSLGVCGIPGVYLPSVAPAMTPGFPMADPSLDPEFAAFREHYMPERARNGRQDAHRRSKTKSSPTPSTRQPDAESTHQSLSNGNTTRRPDSGDDGERTSPDNSNSSTATATNGSTKQSNGEAGTNGCNGVANGGGDFSPPNGDTADGGGPIRNGRQRSKLPDSQKDQAYWERRKKNNEAAKRSRDARRAKEDEIAIRAAYLETQNARLQYELAKALAEVSLLRQALRSGMASSLQDQ